MRKNKFYFLILILLFISSCATNPVTGQKELMLISETQEILIGKKSDAEIRDEYSVYKFNELNSYVTSVGEKLLKYVHRKNLKYKFTILDTPVVNAFAIPGGYVYVTRGILAYLNNEAQLAGVLGHELGHINARHSANMISKQILFNVGVGVGYAVSKDFRKYAGLVLIGGNLLFLKFSRNDEYQADELGVTYATLAGYNTYEMGKFFETLNRLSHKQKYSLPEFLSTHPSPPNRIERVNILTKKWQKKANYKNYKVYKKEYLLHIDGILFGKDKRNGYVEKNHYYHPNMKFTFKFPSGWKLIDTKKYILLSNLKNKNVQILFTISKLPMNKAVSNFMKKTKGIVIEYKNLNINGFRAIKLVENVKLNGSYYTVKTYFIDFRKCVFLIYGMAPKLSYNYYSKSFDIPALSFKKLKDKTKIKVKNTYVKVVKIPEDMTLKKVLIKYKVNKKYFNTIAMMNNLYLNSRLAKGDLIKILIEK